MKVMFSAKNPPFGGGYCLCAPFIIFNIFLGTLRVVTVYCMALNSHLLTF